MGELKPGGPINLKGAVDFARQRPDAPLYVGWDMDLFMHGGSLQVGPRLENIFGRVRLRGMANGANYSSRGELDVDSVTYKNFQFTTIAGPLWFDNANVFLGGAGPSAAGQSGPPRRFTARLLGGTLMGDCQVRLAPIPQYRLNATFAQADLATIRPRESARRRRAQGQDRRHRAIVRHAGPAQSVRLGHDPPQRRRRVRPAA